MDGRSRWDSTPDTGRSGCWSGQRPRRCAMRAWCRSPRHCSDPCDGRTQGTVGMFDSLPYRNDAAITMRRLIRSLPRRAGVIGIATCDKGLPATMLALAGCRSPARHRRPRRRHAAGDRRRGRRQGPDDWGALRARSHHDRRRGGDGLPRVRHARRRLPVSGNGRDVSGDRRSARDDAAAQRALPVRRADLARHGAPVGHGAGGARRPADSARRRS